MAAAASPTLIESAVTVPEKVTLLGAVSAVLNFTVMAVLEALPPFSRIVPEMVIALVLMTSSVELLLSVIFEATDISSFTVTVLEAAIVRFSECTAALKVTLLLRIMSAREVPPTISLKVADPEPSVKVRSRLVAFESLLTVDENVTLLFDVVSVISSLKVTAPVKVCVPEVVMLPPILDAPEMVKAELPAERLIAPSKSKVAKVWVA